MESTESPGARLRRAIEVRLTPEIPSLRKLAERAGLRQNTLSAWWRSSGADVPDTASLKLVAEALGCAPEELLAAYRGTPTPGAGASGDGQTALTAAIEAQTEAINRLIERLDLVVLAADAAHVGARVGVAEVEVVQQLGERPASRRAAPRGRTRPGSPR